MDKTLAFIQVPSNLPDHVDPQIRNFLANLQIELRGWSDDATRDINDLLEYIGPIAAVHPGEIVFGGSGQALAQDPQLKWDATQKVLATGASPTIVRMGLNSLSMNVYYDGTNWQRDDTTKDVFLISLDNVAHWYAFLYAAPAANPVAWVPLSQLNSAGVWSTQNAHRFRHLVTTAKLMLNPAAAMAASGAWQIPAWNVLSWDTDGFWQSPYLVAPYAGYYEITFAVNFSPPLSGADVLIGIFDSAGAWYASGMCFNTYQHQSPITIVVQASAGQAFYGGVNTAVAVTLGPYLTYMTMTYLGE